MRFFFILVFYLFLYNTHADILTPLLQAQSTQATTESESKDSEKNPVEKKERLSPIFNYIKTNQGSVKSPYHQGGVSFDVDPD